MTETVDTAIAKTKPSFADLVAATTTRPAFFSISEQQTEQAKQGLEHYMATEMPKGSPHLAARITTTRNADGNISVECRLDGAMDDATFAHSQKHLVDVLSTHHAFDKHEPAIACEHHDGQVCLTANVVGMGPQDYIDLIHALAEQQHAQETAENNGSYRHDSTHTHEMMIAASKNLKAAIAHELKDEHPSFDVKIEKCKSKKKHGHYRMDIHITGLTETRRGPVLGAFAREMNRKRRGGIPVTSVNGHDEHQDYSLCDPHYSIEDLTSHGFDNLLHKIAKPNSFVDMVQNSNSSADNGYGGLN